MSDLRYNLPDTLRLNLKIISDIGHRRSDIEFESFHKQIEMNINELIIHEDDDIVAVNKPSGILTIPDREGVPGLRNLLQDKFGTIFTIHRIDKDTSGVVVFAKNEIAHRHFSMQFESRETKKFYNGLVIGSPATDTGVINEPIAEHPSKKGLMTVYRKGKESITEYEVTERFRFYSWMRYRILTGRTHQIRVHMKHLGNPIVCDSLYGDGKPVLISQLKSKFNLSKDTEERPILNRLALHAAELELTALDGSKVEIKAPLPKDLKAVLQQLTKLKK